MMRSAVDSTATSLYGMFHEVAQRDPAAVAIEFGERAVSYGDLDASAVRIATGLRGLGVAPGDRVLMYSPNVPEYLAVYLACAYMGAIFAPANIGFRAREMTYISGNVEADVAFVHAAVVEDFLRFTADASHQPTKIVVLGADAGDALGPNQLRFEDLATNGRPRSAHPVAVDDPVLIFCTSGTTSTPKPVLHSHGSELHNAIVYARVWRFAPGDRGLVSLPLAWAYGLSTSSMALFAGGASVLLLPRFHPVDVLNAIEGNRATVMFGTMAMYNKMLDVLRREPHDLSSLRLCVNGGEACTDGAVKAFEEHTGLRLLQAYALSEARPVLAIDPEGPASPRNVSGRLAPGAELRLIDERGGLVTLGEPGEAEVRCPGMMIGYHREPEMTAAKLTPDGWVRTGDLMVEDADGWFRVVGRRSDMIIRSGANVAPAEVESALVGHPSVAEAAVVGVPDAVSGEAIVALVVPHAGQAVDQQEIIDFLSNAIAPYKVPQQIFVSRDLPTTASGKFDRTEFRRLAAELLANAE